MPKRLPISLAASALALLAHPACAVPAAWYATHDGSMAFYAMQGHIENLALHLAEDKINVDIQFHYNEKKPMELDMAFPAAEALPLLAPQQRDRSGLVHVHSGLPLHLQLRVNGQAVAVQKKYFVEKRRNPLHGHRRAGGVDVTRFARDQYSEPVLEYFPKTKENLAFLAAHAIAYKCFAVTGGKAPGDYCAIQSPVAIEYLWKQTLVLGANRLEISYRPPTIGELAEDHALNIDRALHGSDVPGQDAYSGGAQIPPGAYIPMGFYRYHFCIDDGFAKTIRENVRQGRYSDYSAGSMLVYDWDRARQWSGPVKNFHLIVDVKHPDALVFWCPSLGHPRYDKTSPTRVEWKTRNFQPLGQLRMLFVDEP